MHLANNSIIGSSQDKETTSMSIDGWMNKDGVCVCVCVCVCTMEDYSVIKKNEILTLATIWMDLEGITLSEMSEKDKYHRVSFICKIKKMEFM